MNCKPDDIARVYKLGGLGLQRKIMEHLRDRIVQVKLLRPPQNPDCESLEVWELHEPIEIDFGHVIYVISAIEDEYLKPIRGLDGPDETLLWCDVPTKELA